MSSIKDDFDPYYTWLGIRPEEQPADHYRLIGVRQFEDNADVISNAADRQMQFLRTLQVGKRSALSQKLLNEVSAAGGCLLDPERKTAYDNELKAKEMAKAKTIKGTRPIRKVAPLAVAPQPAPLVTSLPEPDFFSLPLPQQTYVPPTPAAQRAPSQPASSLPLILGGAAGGIVLLLVVVIVARNIFSGGRSAAAKVDKGQAGTVKREEEASSLTGINKSPGTVTDSKSGSPEKIEKDPVSDSEKAVSAPSITTAKTEDWQYGIGAFDEQSQRIVDFQSLGHWAGDSWRVSRELPDPKRGWILVGPTGGNVGKTQRDSAIRRWTAPQRGKLSISGELKHKEAGGGDGIRGRIVGSRAGVLGEWKLRYSAAQTPVNSIEVQAGDRIDFIVDCIDNDEYDYFYWAVDLRLTDTQGQERGTWNSETDFHGPLPGQNLASTSPSESIDPNWKPPTADSQAAFSSVLGAYRYSNDPAKAYPFVNLQIPHKNLWTPEIAEKVRGKVPYDEISYTGIAKIAVPADGTYLWDAEKAGRLQIDGKVVSEWDTPKGEIKLTRGVHDLVFEIGSHGGNWMRDTNLALRNKETGEEVSFFNTWQDIQKFLSTPIVGQPVTEVSGWQPTPQNELKDLGALLASDGVNRPDVPTPPAILAIPPKPALPDPAAVAAARKEVAAIFKDDLKDAKTPKARQELAKKMLGIAKATSDLIEKYAILEEVRKLAEEIKDAALAGTVLDVEEADFGIDALSEKVHLLEKLSGGTLTPVQRNELLSVAMGFGDVALAAGKTQALPALTAVIRTLAVKGVTPDRKTEALDFVESLSQRQQDAESLRLAEQKLAKSPDDPEANLIMGLYYCFTVKDDLKGLPLLVKGKDPNFALAGRYRLSVTSTSTLCTLEGANAWADAVPAAPAEYKWRVKKRALEYYQWMLVNSKGPDKAAAQQRHDKLLADIVATLKQSELPRSTPGLVGRVQVEGKDAGIVVTSRPPGELREDRLAAILAQAKGRRARLVLSGTFHCETPGEFRVYHVGREGGPSQVITLDGKPFSQTGGTHGSGGEQRGNVGAGDHVLQWSCEFDLSTRPRLDLSFGPTPEDQKRLEVFASQRQLFEAWKLGTKMDITVSEY